MIRFEKYILDNGLKVILHKDVSSSLAIVNVLYQVGAKHENPERTGFAHLFEHLMFGGSENIPDFDGPLQRAGGMNNAWTNNDLTNYYDVIPSQNLETALWLESDRMKRLAFSPRTLEVQRKVVVEEFKENYLNQPYGDVWFHIRDLAYKEHPYRWPTIGLKPEHIEHAELTDVISFFEKHYCPNNAILVVAGNIDIDATKILIHKWFAGIPNVERAKIDLNEEPKQTSKRFKVVERAVPADRLYKAYHMPARKENGYYACDMLTDVLSLGKASRLHQNLVKDKKIFNSVDAYILGSIEKGLLVIEGQVMPDQDIQKAEAALQEELDHICQIPISEQELQKLKNIKDTQSELELTSLMHKAYELALFEHLGDAGMINEEREKYHQVTINDLQQTAQNILQESNCSTLHYLSQN